MLHYFLSQTLPQVQGSVVVMQIDPLECLCLRLGSKNEQSRSAQVGRTVAGVLRING